MLVTGSTRITVHKNASLIDNIFTTNRLVSFISGLFTGAQPKAGTGHKMQTVSVIFPTLHC